MRGVSMDRFIYKKNQHITVLSAHINEFTYSNHNHEEYLIGVTLQGLQQYDLGNKTFTSPKDHIMLFSPEQVHNGRSIGSTELDYIMLYIQPDIFNQLAGISENCNFTAPIVYHPELAVKIYTLCSALIKNPDWEHLDDALATIVHLIQENHLISGTRPLINQKANNKLLKHVIQKLSDNKQDIPNITNLALELGISKYKLIRSFSKTVGIPPYQYYLLKQVHFAKRLIEDGKDIISVVIETHFSDLSHLNKQFKRVYGVTAFEYQKMLELQSHSG